VESAYRVLKVLHVMGFVFMSIPLFNLIAVNERAQLGSAFDYSADRYMENIIRHGAARCFVFQGTVLVTGVLMLIVGPLGIGALWTNWVLLAKTLLLFILMGLLSYVHLRLQPKIEALLAETGPHTAVAGRRPASSALAASGSAQATGHALPVPRDRHYCPGTAGLRTLQLRPDGRSHRTGRPLRLAG
jgi:hypothetical protein